MRNEDRRLVGLREPADGARTCDELEALAVAEAGSKPLRDPMTPDYEALANEPEAMTALADSLDSAGMYNPCRSDRGLSDAGIL